MLTSNVVLTGKTVLVTGVSGFIGSNLAQRLLQEIADIQVVGIDNMNDYYDVRLKEERLKELSGHESFVFIKGDIADKILKVTLRTKSSSTNCLRNTSRKS